MKSQTVYVYTNIVIIKCIATTAKEMEIDKFFITADIRTLGLKQYEVS